MQLILFSIGLMVLISSCDCYPRPKRSESTGGKVNLVSRSKPPVRLKPGEKKHSEPGWKHCVKKVSAMERWRMIGINLLKDPPQSQFQCTWYIQAVRYDGLHNEKQVVIAIQRLALRNSDGGVCEQQFLEIIDGGKSQGRFCEKNKPGDYVAIGSDLRIDIQVEGGFKDFENSKQPKSPFLIIYKTIGQVPPGFRPYSTTPKKSEYDRYHIGTKSAFEEALPGEEDYPYETDDGETSENNDDNQLTVGGIIGIALCCGLVVAALLFVVLKRYYFRKEKTNRDTVSPESSSVVKVYPFPTSFENLYANEGPLNFESELIISSGIVDGLKSKKSSSNSKSENGITHNNKNSPALKKKIRKKEINQQENGIVSKKSNKSLTRKKSRIHKKSKTVKKIKSLKRVGKIDEADDMPPRRASKKLTRKKHKQGVDKTAGMKTRKIRASSLTFEKSKSTNKRKRNKSENDEQNLKKINFHSKSDKNHSKANIRNENSQNSKRKLTKTKKLSNSTQEDKKSDQKKEKLKNRITKDQNQKTVKRSKTSVRPLTRAAHKSAKKKKRSQSASNTITDKKEIVPNCKKNASLKSEKKRSRTRMRYKRFSSTVSKYRTRVINTHTAPTPSRRRKTKSKRHKSKD